MAKERSGSDVMLLMNNYKQIKIASFRLMMKRKAQSYMSSTIYFSTGNITKLHTTPKHYVKITHIRCLYWIFKSN